MKRESCWTVPYDLFVERRHSFIMHSYYARINTVFFTAVYSLAAVGVLYGILYRMDEVSLI